MFCQSFLFVFIICILQEFNGAYVDKANNCEKQARQLTNRIKKASKDYAYVIKSFDCTLRYIFDGAYSDFTSNLNDLNEMVAKTTGKNCRKDYEDEISRLGEQPFDYCYNRTEIYEGYQKIDKFEKSVSQVCKDCNLFEDCNIKMKNLSEEVEDFHNSSALIIKDLEKRVDECVTNKVEIVSNKLRSLNESLSACN